MIQAYGNGTLPRNPNPVEAALACAYSRVGRRDEAEKRLIFQGSIPQSLSLVWVTKIAFSKPSIRMRRFARIRIGWFLLRADRENPGLLRGDPRLKALRKKVGLPD